tara:strand:- start:754 stop:1641 length:888 start_codon:yes stop_codon:yes gene_type:complete
MKNFIMIACFLVLLGTSIKAQIIEGIVGVVNNEIILLSELNNHIEKSNKNTESKSDKEKFLKELIDLKILKIQGKRMGIEVTEERLNSIVQQIKDKNGEEKFLSELERTNSNLYRLKFELTVQILQENIAAIVLKNKIIISNNEIEKYYSENFSKIKNENLVKLKEFKAINQKEIENIFEIFEDKSLLLDAKINKIQELKLIKKEPKNLGYVSLSDLSEKIRNEIKQRKDSGLIGPLKVDGEVQFFVVLDEVFSDPNFIEVKESIKTTIYNEKSLKLLDVWFSDLRKSMYISNRL